MTAAAKAAEERRGSVFMKKRTIHSIKAVIAVLLIWAIAVNAVPMYVRATTKTKQEIEDEKNKKGQLENQLDGKKDEIGSLKDEQKSLKDELKNLNQQLTEVSEHLTELEEQIAQKEQEIAETQENLEQARITEARQYAGMRQSIRFMYENSDLSYLEALFEAKSFADFLNLADFMERINAYDQKLYGEYQENRKFIESEELRLQNEKTELDELKVEAEAEKSRVSGLVSQTSKEIAKYADEIEEAEKQAKAYEDEIKKVEENIKVLQKRLEEEMAMSRKAANAVWRDISEITFADGDLKLLANIIYCEAGGEPYEGKLAVGAVVINRVRSAVYPNTVVGVIYQKSQFSPVKSGRLELALSMDRANAQCYQAAQEAMSGMTNVGNCLYFRTPIPGLTGIAIGGHIFY